MLPRFTNEYLFAELDTFLARADTCRNSCGVIVHCAIRLAGAADARRVLAMVERAPEAALFSPLITGLRLHLGEISVPTGETAPLALQIAERISEATAISTPHASVA